MTKILFNITHGFQARMLLRSNISEHLLKAGTELILVSPNANEEYFRQEFSHPQITLEKMPSHFSRVESYLISLRAYFLMNPSLGATLNHKNEAFRQHAPLLYYFSRCVNQVLGRFSVLRKQYIRMENWFFPGHDYDELLTRHKPDLIVTGTPGFNGDDIHLLRAAKRFNIPTATVMLSWDNLTSKGYMGVKPDTLLVWSDLMADEAVDYHDFPRDQIHWVGAAQFDHYVEFKQNFDRTAWRTAHGIPQDAKLVVYGTINPGLIPHEIQIVRDLVKLVNDNAFEKPVYLWVRLHPQVVQGRWKANTAIYDELAGPRVRIEFPPVRESSLSWDLPKEDKEHLASLVTAADIVMMTNSTLSIDAACVDTPIVNVYYDGNNVEAGPMTARRFMNYTHSAKILETNGIAKVLNELELVQAVNSYLQQPSLHHAERQKILTQQFNQLDGHASERTASKLLQLAKK